MAAAEADGARRTSNDRGWKRATRRRALYVASPE